MTVTVSPTPMPAPPPRRIPWTLRILMRLGIGVQIGMVVLAFGTLLFWTVGVDANLSAVTFRGNLLRTNGTVTRVEATNSREFRLPIHELRFAYSVDAVRYEGTSWLTGEPPSVGALVVVEYDAARPERSRVEGTRLAMFGPQVLLILIFPALGLALIVWGLRYEGERVRLLRDGVAVHAAVARPEPTTIRVNGRPAWMFTFEFDAVDGSRCSITLNADNPGAFPQGSQVLVLYDPANPSRASTLDAFEPKPVFADTGAILGAERWPLGRLILPVLVVGGNLLRIWRAYF